MVARGAVHLDGETLRPLVDGDDDDRVGGNSPANEMTIAAMAATKRRIRGPPNPTFLASFSPPIQIFTVFG